VMKGVFFVYVKCFFDIVVIESSLRVMWGSCCLG